MHIDKQRKMGGINDLMGRNRAIFCFYNTIIFRKGVLKPHQKIEIADPKIKGLVEDDWRVKEEIEQLTRALQG